MSQWLPPLLALWRETAQERRLTWDSSIPNDLPSLNVDSSHMAQAVGNLVSNAIRYTLPGGAVSVAAGIARLNMTNEAGGLQEDHLWIRVEDTGPGISAEELELVFTPFYRGQTVRRISSSMGLNIARDKVNAHGGRLTLASLPGKGSIITI